MTAEDGRYVSLADLTDWIRRNASVGADTPEAKSLSRLLKSIEGRFDTRTGTRFIATTFAALEVSSDGYSWLRIPRAQSISEVRYKGEVIDATDYELARLPSRTLPPEGSGFTILRRTGSDWWKAGDYELDGSFGWSEPPDDISQAIIETVEFRYNRRSGMQHLVGFEGAVTMDSGYAMPMSAYEVMMNYKESESTLGAV